jgi:hypothetical protein
MTRHKASDLHTGEHLPGAADITLQRRRTYVLSAEQIRSLKHRRVEFTKPPVVTAFSRANRCDCCVSVDLFPDVIMYEQ